jgi:predicted enzyme related to lactoylglutathione lyase
VSAGAENACAEWELMQQITSEPIPVAGFHFVMYLTDDLKRARTFYESLFDLKPGAFESEYFVEYELPDGGAFALAINPSGPRAPTGGAMFGVPDAEAAIARIEALGGSLLARYGGEVCTSGWCTDTEGNSFGVHQRK